MEHYRIVVELGKKKSISRALYVRGDSIIDAYAVSNKVKYGSMVSIKAISFEEYMKGVDKKYTASNK